MSEGAPEGLCPKCVSRAGRETGKNNSGNETVLIVPPSTPTPEEIAKSFPQLEILELLGEGGMGMVYKARQPQLDRFVALKILSPLLSQDPAFAERFSREARALAKLNHPNIVAIYDFGKTGDFYFFVMEFVDGMNLRQLVQAQKRIQPEEALALIPKICEALQYAHEEGVVHRDIKPGNILISKKGRVKIADFGLAKIAGRESKDSRLTGTQDVMGTLHYMAPEQLENPLSVDHRADIYSVGVVFYEMLTGELPIGRFSSPSQKVQVDVRLDEVVLRALEKEPTRRYQNAGEVKTDVETIAATMEKLAARLRAQGGAKPAAGSEAKGKTKLLAWATGAIVVVLATVFITVQLRPKGRVGTAAAPISNSPAINAAMIGFEAAEGYLAGQSLLDQQGWLRGGWAGQMPAGGQGVVADRLPGSAQQAFIGGVAGFTNTAGLQMFVSIRPPAVLYQRKTNGVLEISWRQVITESTTGGQNYFEWIFQNSQGRLLGGLLFCNDTRAIRRRQEDNSLMNTGSEFLRENLYAIRVRFDFPANQWSALIGTNVLPAQPITMKGLQLDLGNTVVTWWNGKGQSGSGDNRLIFDDLTVSE
jgi:predicted Ser/Thr protein kinase